MQNLQLEIRSILHDKHSLTKDDSAKLAMLLNNPTLTSIDLQSNSIHDAGAFSQTQAILINPSLLKLKGVDSPEIVKTIKRNHFYLSYRVDFLLIPEFFQKGVPTAENPDVENPFLLLPMEIRIKILRCCVPSSVTMQSIKRFADSPERLRFFQQKIEQRSQTNLNLEGALQVDRDDQSCKKNNSYTLL